LPKKGTNLRQAGEDLRGSSRTKRGQPLHPAEIGMMASLSVKFPSTATALSTGDELAPIGQPLGPGQIYDSNRYTIFGMLSRLGCEVLDMGVIRDNPDDVEQAFRQAAESADVVMTSGGVSVGEADYVKQILDKLGQVLFWKLAMKPGGRWPTGKSAPPISLVCRVTRSR
jgi:molybdopterin molybdotransferase